MLVALAGLAFTRSATGHGADSGDFTLPEIVDWLHLPAICLCSGSLLAAALAVFPVVPPLAGKPAPTADFAHRLSRLATVILLAVILTGACQVMRMLPQRVDLWQGS